MRHQTFSSSRAPTAEVAGEMVVEEAKSGGEGREWEGVVQDQARLFLATVARAQEGDAMPVRDAARPQHGPPGVGDPPAYGGEGEHNCIS